MMNSTYYPTAADASNELKPWYIIDAEGQVRISCPTYWRTMPTPPRPPPLPSLIPSPSPVLASSPDSLTLTPS